MHCDMGHNRSPALILAFLVSQDLSLRDAYRRVLRVRPTIDPLPPYRRALRAYELARQGTSTVSEEEPFGLHTSQLQVLVSELCGNQGTGESEDIPALTCYFDQGLALRDKSIEALLSEEGGAEDKHKEEPPKEARPHQLSGNSLPAPWAKELAEEQSSAVTISTVEAVLQQDASCRSCERWRDSSSKRRHLLNLFFPKFNAKSCMMHGNNRAWLCCAGAAARCE